MDVSPKLEDFGWCPFAHIVGEPCILCGGTRAFLSFGGGNLRDAFEFNAVVTCALTGIVVVLLFGLVKDRSTGNLIVRIQNLSRRVLGVPIWAQVIIFGVWWMWNVGRW
jgi:hypothetical protein